jgi:SAM-dependent methyltransferase
MATTLKDGLELRLSPTNAAKLRCPRCKQNLEAEGSGLHCTNTDCGNRYPVVDGIPVLFNEEFSLFRNDAVHSVVFKPPEDGGLRRRIKAMIPTLSRNYRATENYRVLRRLLEDGGGRSVLVVGGGTAAIGIRELKHSSGIDIVETDVFIGPETQAVCDAHDLPFADNSFDAVIIQGVICYLQQPERAVGEIHRVLKQGGLVYSETPFVQQITGGRFDCVRYTPVGHRRLFRHFTEVGSGPIGGPGMVLAWAWHYFLLSLASGKRSRSAMSMLARLTAFPLPPLDRWLARRPWAIDTASGVYFLGRRSDAAVAEEEILSSYSGAFH